MLMSLNDTNLNYKKEITSITVCHICYQYFASPEQLNPHIKQFHSQTNKKKGIFCYVHNVKLA